MSLLFPRARVALAASLVLILCAMPAGAQETLFASPYTVTTVPGAAATWFDGPALQDFTNDGNRDALFLFGPPATLALFTFTSGTVAVTTTAAAGFGEDVLAGSADVNLDGLPDAILCKSGSCAAAPCGAGSILVMLSAGNGSFSAASSLAGAPLALRNAIAVSDLNGDGATEVVIAGEDGSNSPVLAVYSIHPVTMVISIVSYQMLAASTSAVAVGEFNGDGLRDIALGATTAGYVTLVYQLPGQTFTPGLQLTLPQALGANTCTGCAGWVQQLAVSDFDQNGSNELYVRGSWSNAAGGVNALWLVPVGGGQIASSSGSVSLFPHAHRLAVGNFDDDYGGNPEILLDYAVKRILPFNLMGYLWLFGGSMALPTSSVFECSHAAADMDGDGDLDVVGAYRALPVTPGCNYPCTDIAVRYLENLAVRPAGCGGAQPSIGAGTPTLPNPAFAFTLTGAQPGALAALGISTGPASIGIGSCLIGIDPAQLVFPSGSLDVATVDATGMVFLPRPIPYVAQLLLTSIHAQWIWADPAGPLVLGNAAYSMSPVRKLVFF